jgi:cell division protein ZapA
MGELSIKIKIADRDYPMKVDAGEEENIRFAAKLIGEKLKFFKDQFGIDDKQDLLAMVAFDSMVEKLQVQSVKNSGFDSLYHKVKNLNDLISQVV